MYLEIGWEFVSWVPFVSGLCPNDRYQVWKQGPHIRIDTTLVGFERLSWIRGNVSFLFRVDEERSRFYLIDHDKRIYEEIDKLESMTAEDLEMQINLALNTDIVHAKVEQQKGAPGDEEHRFVRKQGGLFGLSGDRTDTIAGHETAVWDIPDVEVLTRKRREHLRDRPEAGASRPRSLDLEDVERKLDDQADAEMQAEIGGYLEDARATLSTHVPSLPRPPGAGDRAAYFGGGTGYAHQGRPLDMSETRKLLHPSVWMAPSFPLSISNLLPVFEIMSPTGKHFERLSSFIRMDMPPGFPVRLEVPIFGFLTGRVTFENFYDWMDGLSRERIPAPKSLGRESHTRAWFELPAGYAPGDILKTIFKPGGH